MKKKGSGDQIGGVSGARGAEQVRRAAEIAEVSKVQQAAGVGGVQRVGGIGGKRRPTRVMSVAEREKIFEMIDQEAERLFREGGVPEGQRSLVKAAVKMAIDTGLVEEPEQNAQSGRPGLGGNGEKEE